MNTWQPDVLGGDFEALTLPLGEDNEGPIEATLVRLLPPLIQLGRRRHPFRDVDVLYVHGWSDYFFNPRLATFWAERGARFYALDLRKYGRSLRAGQTAGYITDLAEYDVEIAAAFEAMGRSASGEGSDRRLVLMGHSTGGLTLSLWAARYPGVASALVLNSPWLEFQLTATSRQAISPIVNVHAAWRPMDLWPQVDAGYYSRAQREVADPDDPLTPNAEWRPDRTMPVHVGWVRAILAGHRAVSAGLNIETPVLVMLSAVTVTPTSWSESMKAADTVLVVDDIARASLKLGSSVTIERITGALHDVFISEKEARKTAYVRMDRWARGALATL